VRPGNQDPVELAGFLALISELNVRRYCEIGCRNGDTFLAVMETIGAAGSGLAVDLPENAASRRELSAAVDELREAGISAFAAFGDSASTAVIDAVRGRGPFDLILIDADHRYDGVRRDLLTYAGMAPLIALHDVAAPDDHMSDGHPNGVGRLWREVKDLFEHREIVNPGSHMGFGILMDVKVQVLRDFLNGRSMAAENEIIEVPERRARELEQRKLASRNIRRDLINYIPGSPLPPLTAETLPPVKIGIPAWGKYWVDVACDYVIPAVKASLRESDFHLVEFLIYSDREGPWRKAIGDDYEVTFPELKLDRKLIIDEPDYTRLPGEFWVEFKRCHKDILARTPSNGAIAVMLNSDVVPSRECFRYVQEKMIEGYRVVASVGIRTQNASDFRDPHDNPPPIGADAETLFRWIWGNLHHISRECRWNGGRSQHPTILFFEDDAGNVEMRGFHLTPMFIRKDRNLAFLGTIDDDLLGRFLPEEIAYPLNGEVAFAELSPVKKGHPFGLPLGVSHVEAFWRGRVNKPGRMRPHYLRNFQQRLPIIGRLAAEHPAAAEIATRLESQIP
jgi:hypothetical protein